MLGRRDKTKDIQRALEEANNRLKSVELLQADRAVLVSIVIDGRLIRFGFVRNGKLTYVETYRTMSDDVTAWQAALLSPQS